MVLPSFYLLEGGNESDGVNKLEASLLKELIMDAFLLLS